MGVTVGEELSRLAERVEPFWSYGLLSVGGTPLTMGKVISAFLFLGLGGLVARQVSRALGRRVFPRMGFDEGGAHAFEQLTFYVLLVSVVLIALRIVQIPLTAFAVVGGALAIGIGFGSQNVVNNFISGLILLAERPIKVGDMIQLDDVWGNVERIGLRSTRIRTGDNVHIIVPNATFLETNVTNWTHRNPEVRLKIPVGVIYGSPVADVKRLLLQAITEHPRILEKPEPIVLFRSFGDDSLLFEMWFWVRIQNYTSRAIVESDIHERVDELFREAGLVIAFPQRDVHLDAARPLEITMVPPGSSEERP
ncbi:MAG: mechanosensitive ion channel [Myxococcales bacterium]|nr:mechanosensitive ion channel [Myxococcales bacterium]